MAKRILGLDLGSASVGWAVIDETDEGIDIVAMGSRIIPLSADDATQFTKGQTITKNSDRTQKRTQRKGYDRYQLRRRYLSDALRRAGLSHDESLVGLRPLQLWGLRARAVTEQIALPELGRVLFHLNQKRGYKSSKSDYADTKQSQYVQQVNDRYRKICERHQTIGQYFYECLSADSSFRCKDEVYPRAAYVEEFDAIMACQRRFYPDILTPAFVDELRNKIIYYQRPLRSCKHLVSLCDFEKKEYVREDGRMVLGGRKVAPRTSPLFQVCKIWESVNTIRITNKINPRDTFPITLEQKRMLFDFMNCHEKMKIKDIFSILGISAAKGWRFDRESGAGLQGNTTRIAIDKALGDYPYKDDLMRFELHVCECGGCNEQTGEMRYAISPEFENEPLYMLWHALYSISDAAELDHVLWEKFGIEDASVREALCRLDFVKAGYGNKSSRAMRRILPYLMRGEVYSEACQSAGFNHSNSLTAAQNEARELADKMNLLEKGELRQPIVEKILNQMINVVNAAMTEYGRFDEIHIELARELKQSREERKQTSDRIAEDERRNAQYAKRIADEYHLQPTKTRIRKMRLYEETGHLCMYCNQTVEAAAFLLGEEVEREHVIPKSLLFDDSFSNQVCACRKCNQDKGNRTAYDYMQSKGAANFQDYIDRVNKLYEGHKISKAKYEKLMMPAEKIPDDFIDRQLRESQYIARKAKELLATICRTIVPTSGSVTDFLRHVWGWDNVLHDLNFERYRAAGLTEMKDCGSRGEKEMIKEWNKRLDHRHHAIDALTIACTKQSYIRQLNTLQTLKDVPFKDMQHQSERFKERHTQLERYVLSQPHFTTAEVAAAADCIAVSFKAGKRLTTPGKRYVYRGDKPQQVQCGILIPRGALCEDSVYGSIERYAKGKNGKTVLERLSVIKYPLSKITAKNVKDIVDKDIRTRVSERLAAFGNKEKDAFAQPLYDHQGHQIKSVRCLTGLTAVVPVSRNDKGEPIGFVKPGNNHHAAIYADAEGNLEEHIVTFWHAVERKKYGIPVIIERSDDVWDNIAENIPEEFLALLPKPGRTLRLSMQQNEMFILGMSDEEYRDAMSGCDYAALCKHLYRVQKLATRNYVFRYHIETKVDDKYGGVKNEKLSMQAGKFKSVRSIGALLALNPHKVRVTLLGKIEDI